MDLNDKCSKSLIGMGVQGYNRITELIFLSMFTDICRIEETVKGVADRALEKANK